MCMGALCATDWTIKVLQYFLSTFLAMCFSDGASHQCLLEQHHLHEFAIVKAYFDLVDGAGD
jgi:hypothetical protein